MDKDMVFEYLKAICNKKEIREKYEKLFLTEIRVLTTGYKFKLDFLILFTISIFNQGGTDGLLCNKRIRNEWLEGNLDVSKYGKIGENHRGNKGNLIQFISQWKKSNKQLSLDNFVKGLSEWINIKKEEKPYVDYSKHKNCIKGVKAFKDFLDKIEKNDLQSFKNFTKKLCDYGFIKIEDENKDKKIRIKEKAIPGMGEKTFGLFIECFGFYTKRKKVFEEWKKEGKDFPIYGFNETNIKKFLKDVYKYYARILYDNGLFKNFYINGLVSIDVLWNAYRRGETFPKYQSKMIEGWAKK